ncbi:Pol II transcription elongation factor [Ceratobasidium sp. AG-Ba]|nr:Pol II transcription elongation factor [Ceratobasidium sp. AG-Ba]
MRNLSLLSSAVEFIPEGNRAVTGTTFDTDEKVTYVATEKQLPDGRGVDVEVWKMPAEDGIPFATLSSEVVASFDTAQQVVSFVFLAESRQLVIILAGGDIAVLAVDEVESSSEFEIIGSVEPGIKAAAWGPDESQVVLVNGKDELLVMSKDFDVLFENPLRPADLGQEKQTALGWGSKQTQFHGSLGKAAAASEAPTTGQGGVDNPSPDDDTKPRISWRGDGAHFVVSSLDPSPTGQVRKLRFYSSNPPAHLSTSETTPGLEGVLAWRPSGGFIATAQRFGYEGGGVGRMGRHDVLFFERNGLRRHDFGIRDAVEGVKGDTSKTRPWGYRIKEIIWSTDSALLALWIERDEGDCVQLWTTGNYHWYLKQEFRPFSGEERYTGVVWHPENPLRIICTTNHSVEDRVFMWDTCASNPCFDDSPGTVVVVDGNALLVTPFKLQNVPPPMSSFKVALGNSPPPVHMALSSDSRLLGLLFPTLEVQVWELGLRTGMRGKIAEPKVIWSSPLTHGLARPRQVVVSAEQVMVLGSDSTNQQLDIIQTLPISQSSGLVPVAVTVSPSGRLVGDAWYQDAQGDIRKIEGDKLGESISLSRFCLYAQTVPSASGDLFVGLDSAGKLFAITKETTATEVSSNVNSFALTSGFLAYTTTAHEIKFTPIPDLSLPEIGEKERSRWGTRRVERGSRIVCVVPSNAAVVLQLPRGNLETINPRPLVLASVQADVERGEFRRAFLACRKHRVDLDLLVDFSPTVFADQPTRLADQVPEVDHLNLFLTGLGQSKRPQEQIATICDNLRIELQRRGYAKYVQTILTAHVVKSPPDVESALQVLHTLREAEPKAVEEAVKYIIFLVDADQLFNVALGMYDFALVLMIAQQSQKDPREYLPFLRELRALDTHYQRYRINDYLGRREVALENLSLAGDHRFEEAKRYTEKHQLYLKSLNLWKDRRAEYAELLALYGEWLVENREFSKAGQAFSLAKETKRAMFAFEKARMWKELFALAAEINISSEDLVDMGYRVAESLTSHSRYLEAARVYVEYAHDVRAAVSALCRGNDLSEAFRIVSVYKTSELVEEVIEPEAKDLCSQLSDDVQEMREQLDRQGQRLIDLKEKKQSDPSGYYGHEEPNLHNVDALTDASGIMTQFTRYTKALTGTTAKRSQKSSKKAARKAGRKGTADEEEYILASLVKLVQRLEHVQKETAQLLPHLSRLSSDHEVDGARLLSDINAFEQQLRVLVDREWPQDAGNIDSAAPPALPRPSRPTLPKNPWHANLIRV